MTCEGCGSDMAPREYRGGLTKRFCSQQCQKRVYRSIERAGWTPEKRARANRRGSERRLERELGVSAELYELMRNAQAGVCALCDRPETRQHGRLSVDHDHDSGRVRGLLCASCNTALGRLGDGPAGLQRALAYVEGRV